MKLLAQLSSNDNADDDENKKQNDPFETLLYF